jgi:hypothetical protein
MCQPMVRSHLDKMVGEVKETHGVRDFGTLRDLGCSDPKGPKVGTTWKDYETLGVRDSERSCA